MSKKAQKRKAAKKPKKEPKPKRTKSEKQGERTRLLAENPSMTPEELPPVVLQHLIRAVQKHQVADWQAYVRRAEPTQKKTDPAAHSVEVLQAFVKQLLQGGEGESSSSGGGKTADFVKRYLKWTHQINKEHSCQATSMPAPATIKALTPPSAAPSASNPSPGKAAASATETAGASSSSAPSSSGRGSEPPMSPWVLVQATRNHPKFRTLYNLPSYLRGWARTKRRALGRAPSGPATEGSQQPTSTTDAASGTGSVDQRGLAPVLLAMDCEMCETDKEQAALVGLCVSDERGRVLYQALVRPHGDITNLRTEVTGITQQDLDTKPTVSRSEARKAVKGLLLDAWRKRKQPTILVGHALHHDLVALRLDHQPVIDTSLIFGYQGLPSCTPGLRDLCLSVLQQDMPARGQGRHDSVEDATVSMKLVQHELAQRQRTPPFPPPEIKVDKADLSKLLVHSIPKGTTEQEILDLFAQAGAAAAANGAAAPHAAAKQAQGTGGGSEKKGDGESSSESGSSDSESDSSGSESESESESESDSESEEEGGQKRRRTGEQATPSKQQQQQQQEASKRGGSEGSSSDSSESDSSESESESEEEEGGKRRKEQGKAKGSVAASSASAAAAAGASQSGAASSSGGYQVPQPTGFEGKGIENKRAVLLFKNPDHATTAFNSLQGKVETDSTGRMSKEVQLPGEPQRTVKVRRMAAHNGLLFQVPKGAKKGQAPVQLPGTGPDGQPLTRRDKYRQRELLGKKKKKPQDLLAAQAKTMKKKARREKKKERKAAVAESQGKVVIRTPKGPKVKRQRPFKKKTPAEKAAAHAAAVAAGGVLPDGRHVKITKKDQKKAEKKAAKAQHAQKRQERAAAQPQKKAE